nr:hypothetical protein [Tanacetum cinerariifolium]
MKHEKGTDEEADSFDDQLDTPDEVEDSSDARRYGKTQIGRERALFYFSSDEESGDADTKGVNDKSESSQATPKAQSSQAKAPRTNVIVGLASQYKNLATNYVEKKFGIRTPAEGSKRKGKRRVGAVSLTASRRLLILTFPIFFMQKEVDDNIKEGTLNLDDGTDAMTVMFGKEKEGYARGVVSGVTYKRYFDLPQSRQATDERIELLQT